MNTNRTKNCMEINETKAIKLNKEISHFRCEVLICPDSTGITAIVRCLLQFYGGQSNVVTNNEKPNEISFTLLHAVNKHCSKPISRRNVLSPPTLHHQIHVPLFLFVVQCFFFCCFTPKMTIFFLSSFAIVVVYISFLLALPP